MSPLGGSGQGATTGNRLVRVIEFFLLLVVGSTLSLAICSCSAATGARTCCAPGEPDDDCRNATDGSCEPATSEKVKNALKNLPQLGAIVGEARTTRDVEQVFRHLEKYHGIDRRLASERLHDIKFKNGLPNDADLIFDMTGNVYSPTTLELLGSMSEGGAKLIRQRKDMMPKPKVQVFAIIRIDSEPPPGLSAGGPGVDPTTLVNRSIAEVAVTSVVPSAEAAAAEVERLNRLNGAKGARYYWMATRYYPEGKARDDREE